MRISIGLMACRVNRYYEEQMRACYVWIKSIDRANITVKFLCGEKDHPSTPDDIIKDEDVVYLKGVGTDYMSATDKQFDGLLYLHQHHPADYYLIAGTDNYIVTNRLLGLMKEYNCSPEDDAILGGHCFYNCHLKIHFFSGGAGIFITKSGMNRLGPLFNQHKKEWESIINSRGAGYLKPACDVSLFWLAEQFRNADPPFKLINVSKIYGCRTHSEMCLEYDHTDFRWNSVVILHYLETESQMRYVHNMIRMSSISGHNIQLISQITDTENLERFQNVTTSGIIWGSLSDIDQANVETSSIFKIQTVKSNDPWLDMMKQSVYDTNKIFIWLSSNSFSSIDMDRWVDDIKYSNQILETKCYLVVISGYPELVISPDILMGRGKILQTMLKLYEQISEETGQINRSIIFRLLYEKYPEMFSLSYGTSKDLLSNILYPRRNIKTVLDWVKQNRAISNHRITYLINSKIMEVIDTGNLPLGSNTNNYTDSLVDFAAEYYLSCWYNDKKDLCYKLIKSLVSWGRVTSVRESINKRIDYLVSTTDFSIPFFKKMHPNYRTVNLSQPNQLVIALEHFNNSDVPVLIVLPGYGLNYYSLIGHKIIIRPTAF